jgi:hypothetical protein
MQRLLLLILLPTALLQANVAVAGGPDFRDDVLPLLKLHCVRCHGPAKQEGELNLSLPTAIARGGENGPAINPAEGFSSLLWQRVEANEMPPEEPLPDMAKQILKQWLAAGAPGLPAEVSPEPNGDEHWAYQPLFPSEPPAALDTSRVRNDIDRFIQFTLESRGLSIAEEAGRVTLIRRVAFDLTGLPPTPEEIAAFINDPNHRAYEDMVDRYLASPHYGERWGKYWLDAAGYADSNGYFNADTDRPHAFRYRDWVINAVNSDQPFDVFLREQLAGDTIAGYKPGGDVTPEMLPLLAATHFLRNSPDGTDSSDGNDDERRADKYAVLEGSVQIMGSALFGITTQCARCHDHKFEPFRQRDYYQLQAMLFPAFNVENWIYPKDRHVPAAASEAIRAWEAEHPLPPETENAEDKPDPRARLAEAFGELAFVADSDAPATAPLLERGDYKSPGDALPAAAPSMVSEPTNPAELSNSETTSASSARLRFAHWLTQPNSRAAALLARVTVNRWWAHHFGAGIVATPENLGYSGAAPTHPELLDHLAGEFIRQGWSAKSLHRLILNSATYRQGSTIDPASIAQDPDAELLSRFPLQRLDAEAIRDAMLAISGELDATSGGPYIPTTRAADGDVVIAADVPGANRRSIYLQQRRTQVVGILDVFDAPSLVTNCTQRVQTTIPLQSLKLLNSDFVGQRAAALARRSAQDCASNPTGRLERCFLLAWGRAPTSAEAASAQSFLEQQPASYPDRTDAAELAWADFCQALLASNAFLYVH